MRDIVNLLFGGWSELLRILVVGTLAYVGMLLFLRAAGKRALAKLSAYDFVVTVALGSMLATALLSQQVTLDRALLAIALLLALQRLAAWASMRSPAVRRLINNEPALVAYRGRMLEQTMKQETLSREDIEAAVRKSGVANLGEVEAVIVETDGSISVIPSLDAELAPPLADAQRELQRREDPASRL